MTSMRTGPAALIFAACCCLLASQPAFAKDGVRARLEAPRALADAEAGSRLRIAWTLSAARQRPVGGTPPSRQPSGASGLPAPVGGSPPSRQLSGASGLPAPVGGSPPSRQPSGASGLPVAFGASGVYIRVRSAADGRSRIFRGVSAAGPGRYSRGRYVADVTLPKGGVAGIAIGLDGWRHVRGRPAEEADVFFPIDNDPFAGPAVGSGGAGLPWVAGALLLVASAALGLVVAGRRTRRRRAG